MTDAYVCEIVANNFKTAFERGARLCLDIEDSVPDFRAMDSQETFEVDKFFSREEIRNLMSQVPDRACKAFSMSMRSNAKSEEDVMQQISKVPFFDTNFNHIVIE